ncbi:MAG: FAD-dependent oxidoreductase [Kofleriaceae bacterium]|nr:FAD-dependent oxidoreductase [Kofleriaceae bacterium]
MRSISISADIAIAVIGGGAVGQAIAYSLGRAGKEVVVVEACRHDRIENQSTRNSGVIHAGLYYEQKSQPLKARLCVQGNSRIYEFCQEYGVPHQRTGKIVVATDEREKGYLQPLLQTARENGVPDVEMIGQVRINELEANVRGCAALYLPSSGVIDSAAYLRALHQQSGAHTLWGTKVLAVTKVQSGFEIRTLCGGKESRFIAGQVVNSAGLYADEVARMINPESPYDIMAVRGESVKFYTSRRPTLTMHGLNVYPVPCGFYKETGHRALLSYVDYCNALASGGVVATTGVHLTPTLDSEGNISSTVSVGPALTLGMGKENFGGKLRNLEYYHSQVSHFFPALEVADMELHQTGIQARLADHRDWIIERDSHESDFINLIGIDSPGLTASLAIAREVVDLLTPSGELASVRMPVRAERADPKDET